MKGLVWATCVRPPNLWLSDSDPNDPDPPLVYRIHEATDVVVGFHDL